MSKELIWAKENFIKYTDYTSNDVIKIKQIHKGYTNISFLFYTSDNNKYQVRIAGPEQIVDRVNEKNILELIEEKNYLHYDKHGNVIKKWINGKNPTMLFKKKKIINLLLDQINILHSVNIKNANIVKHNSLSFFNLADWSGNEKHREKYLELLKSFSNISLVLSHNDLNLDNVVYLKDKISLIDYEWGRINYYYWDIANFFRETNLSIKWVNYIAKIAPEYEKEILIKFIYFSTCFAFQWTYAMHPTNKILKYRKKIIKQMNNYTNWL
ncbi:MAG: hypothetical protein RSA87_02800 [Malacoplasma sp.]